MSASFLLWGGSSLLAVGIALVTGYAAGYVRGIRAGRRSPWRFPVHSQQQLPHPERRPRHGR